MMRRAINLYAVIGFAVLASPAVAQQTAPTQLPTVDQSSHSVPPAPPPPRQAESPPPFPSFPYVEPRHRHTHPATRSTQHRGKQESTKRHSSNHATKQPTRQLTKQEKKDQRYCSSLSQRQIQRNSKCRKLIHEQRETSKPRSLTKQEKKDERYCGSLSLRQVMQNNRCRKVAERQLEATKHQEKSKRQSKNPHKTERHKRTHSDSQKHVTKHRR